MHESQICFFDLPIVELAGKRLMRLVCARDDERAAGLAIEAVHNAGAQIAGDLGQRAEMVQKRVDQRAARVSSARVNDHTGGFINNDHVRILIQDGKRQSLRFGFERRQFERRDGNVFGATQ